MVFIHTFDFYIDCPSNPLAFLLFIAVSWYLILKIYGNNGLLVDNKHKTNNNNDANGKMPTSQHNIACSINYTTIGLSMRSSTHLNYSSTMFDWFIPAIHRAAGSFFNFASLIIGIGIGDHGVKTYKWWISNGAHRSHVYKKKRLPRSY